MFKIKDPIYFFYQCFVSISDGMTFTQNNLVQLDYFLEKV